MKVLNPLADSHAKAVVLIFLSTDCPISNRYAPLVNRIYSAYKEKGIEFYAVYPISSQTVEGIEAHRKDFEYKLPALRDTNHFPVKMGEAIVTPETSVYLPALREKEPGSTEVELTTYTSILANGATRQPKTI